MERMKLKIPPFKRKGDPKTYLEWELKIKHLFSCYNYTQEQKVRMTSAKSSMRSFGGINIKRRGKEMKNQ